MRGITAHLFCIRTLNSVASSQRKALAAIHRLALGRSEGHLALLPAISADGREHLARTLCAVLTGIAACFASLRFVLEPLLRIEFLLTCREHKFVAAVLAFQCLVLIHVFYLALIWCFSPLDGFQPTPLITTLSLKLLEHIIFISTERMFFHSNRVFVAAWKEDALSHCVPISPFCQDGSPSPQPKGLACTVQIPSARMSTIPL